MDHVVFAAMLALSAQDLPLGSVEDRVTCRADEKQSYALYLPPGYTPQRAWPILYCLDPGARGRVPVDRFAEAAGKEGMIVAGSNNSRNGPIQASSEAIDAMVRDTGERFRIDDRRIYVAGFSGGARLALSWARNGRIAGVVACGAGFGESPPPKQLPYSLFAAAGVDDFNYPELYALSRTLDRNGVAHRFATFEGGHDWLPPGLAAEALAFFAGRVPARAAAESREERRRCDRFRSLSEQLARAEGVDRTALVHDLRHNADREADTADRRIARQVLGGAFINALEEAHERSRSKDYAAAARAWETAVALRPDNAGAWYSLAMAQSGAGNRRRALEALEHAVAQGFRDGDRVQSEPLLAPLRGQKRYQAALESMR